MSSEIIVAHRPRGRDLGVPFPGSPGLLNAITDVPGVEVGHCTLISGEGQLQVGVGPVRTGVTAVLPRGRENYSPVFAGWFSLNGNGEMTGTAWIDESGLLGCPIMLTNTHSVGVVRDAVIGWQVRNNSMPGPWSLPVVAETWDGRLNDINGFHVKAEHAYAAIDGAVAAAVEEGNAGGGTGMICHGFKGGIGSASRIVGEWTVGVLVQANHGAAGQLIVSGVPVGAELQKAVAEDERGSIIIVIGTDAPALPHQLKAMARRAAMGLARTGSCSGISSGDLFLAFSTANLNAMNPACACPVTMLGLDKISCLFEAVVQATEEAIINALAAAESMSGIDGFTVMALPHDELIAVLRKYNRLTR